MFGIITKADYWSYRDAGACKPLENPLAAVRTVAARLVRPGLRSPQGTARLKDIQDAFALAMLQNEPPGRLLELGGGDSRVLPSLSKRHECWNIDKLIGEGGGPVKTRLPKRVRIVRDYMGSFNPEIPDGAFDVVFSISAVEHIPDSAFADAMRDCYRVLKPGGRMYHAIDVYLFDGLDQHPHSRVTQRRIKLYRTIPEITGGGMDWIEPPQVDETVLASASFACNQCDDLYYWNHTSPTLKDMRAIAMSCSLKVGLIKRG